MGVSIFIIVILLFFTMYFLMRLDEAKAKSLSAIEKAKEQKIRKHETEDLKFEVLELNLKYRQLVSQYNELVRNRERLLRMYKELELKSLNQDVSSSLSKEDIKRLKYYIHPDKHNGKTNDLFIKLGIL